MNMNSDSTHKKNIALIGMPGSGKTVIGRRVAYRMKKYFFDADEYLEDRFKESIPGMFARSEEFFRGREAIALAELSRMENIIIATGGGAVLRAENMSNLKKSSLIIFINRPLEAITADVNTQTRPLLANGVEVLQKLYEQRIELYKKYADYEVINNRNLAECVTKIINYVEKQNENFSY